jgi:hypothetical protein
MNQLIKDRLQQHAQQVKSNAMIPAKKPNVTVVKAIRIKRGSDSKVYTSAHQAAKEYTYWRHFEYCKNKIQTPCSLNELIPYMELPENSKRRDKMYRRYHSLFKRLLTAI